ncbi:hypothetical protein CDL15_Pgr000470 [Punica granatum]|uniref:non-specific serine/threonine protein kinase n=1 Tax=Punica granatum TaxID=22663 RepID=A0A218W3H6_PUNGR|nr:hypothetical protein CDL15_Pgr000470 [Punica granatum]
MEGNQLLLGYEYLENNLKRALFGCEEQRLNLDWATRRKICIRLAKGLAHLHEEFALKFVHRDITATNVLLDVYFNAKILDFGLAKIYEVENGYMAPEYVREGHLTVKANVFSLGVVTLEIVGGKCNEAMRMLHMILCIVLFESPTSDVFCIDARNKIEREEGVRVVAEVIDILRGYKQPQWRGRGYRLAALTPESTGDFESDFPIDSEAGDVNR